MAEAVLPTRAALHVSLPRAVTVLLTEQVLVGAVKVVLKLAVAPGARVATVNTMGGDDWLLLTVTLLSAISPEFLTVPV